MLHRILRVHGNLSVDLSTNHGEQESASKCTHVTLVCHETEKPVTGLFLS